MKKQITKRTIQFLLAMTAITLIISGVLGVRFYWDVTVIAVLMSAALIVTAAYYASCESKSKKESENEIKYSKAE